MKIVVLIAVAAIVLLELTDAMPKSSVGGPMAMLMVVFLAVLSFGFAEGLSQRRGVLGALVSVMTSLIGGLFGVAAAGAIIEPILSRLNLGVPLADSQHPLRYIASAGMMLLALLGAWVALQIVNRLR